MFGGDILGKQKTNNNINPLIWAPKIVSEYPSCLGGDKFGGDNFGGDWRNFGWRHF